MFKKILTTSIICLIASTCFFTTPAFAEEAPKEPTTKLFIPAVGPAGSKLERVAALPKADWQTIIANVIKLVLGITGSLALVAFVVGGVMFVTGSGEEEKLSKAKDIISWSMVALLIIASAYAIVLGITELKFFE